MARRGWWPAMHTAMTVAIIVAACAGDTDPAPVADGRADRTAPGSSTADAATRSTPNERSMATLQQARRYQFPDPTGSLQREHGLAPVVLPPGRYTADSLGIDVTLDLDRAWRLEREEPGSFSITRPDAPLGGLLPRIDFVRPIGLAPVTRVGDPDLFAGEYTSPPDDLEAWIDEVDQLAVRASGTTSVGARDGAWFELDVVDDVGPVLEHCDPAVCLHTAWAGGSRTFVARDRESTRVYTFPDPAGPIFVVVTASEEEFPAWSDLAEDLLASVSFGPTAAHPVDGATSVGVERSHEPASTTGFVAFPELTATAERFSVSFQRPGLLTFQPWLSYGNRSINRPELVRAVATGAGAPIGDVASLESALEAAGLTRLGADALLDGTVSAFEGRDVSGLLRRAELDEGDDARFVLWPPAPYPRLVAWVLDGPSDPLLLAAVTIVDEEPNVAEATNEAEQMLAAIDFR